MIQSRKEMIDYICADRKAQGMQHPILASLTFGENYQIRKYLTTLRKVEFYKNTSVWGGKFLYAYNLLKLRKLSLKLGFYIAPNSVGKGFHMVHLGFVRIDKFVHIGDNCTILPMVLFGKAHPGEKTEIFVGNNCYIGTGATILGNIKIGNNVTIGAGAVVLKDIPDNVVVAGIPASVIRYIDKSL